MLVSRRTTVVLDHRAIDIFFNLVFNQWETSFTFQFNADSNTDIEDLSVLCP